MAFQFTAKLKEALEVLAGLRGNSLDHAVRRRELDPYLNVIGKAELRVNAVLGNIRTIETTAEEAFEKHDETLASALSAVSALNTDILNRYGAYEAIDQRTLIEQLEVAYGPLNSATSLADQTLPRLFTLEEGLTDIQATIDTSLVVDGEYVTFANVIQTIDALAGEVSLKATQVDLNNLEARTSAAEVTLSTIEGASSIGQAVEAYRRFDDDLDEMTQLTMGELWDRWNADRDYREALAQATSDLSASVDEKVGAVASNVTVLRTDYEGAIAQVRAEQSTRSSELEAVALDVTQLRTDYEGNIAEVLAQQSATSSELETVALDVTQLRAELETAEGDIAANADAFEFLATRVTANEDGLTAQSQQLTALQSDLTTLDGEANANANAISGLNTTVTQQGNTLSAQADSIDGLEADLNTPTTGVLARLTNIEAVKVDAAGARAAVTQSISASYGSLSAMASATAFAEAQADKIAAGYVWKLNGSNVMELVSVANGTSGPVVTGKIKSNYLQITGLTQIDQAVINSLSANSGFINNLSSNSAFITSLVSDNAFLNNVQIGRGQITDVLQSDNFSFGDNGDGARIHWGTGYAVFNNVVVRRQIEVAAGSITVGDFVTGLGFNENNGNNNNLNEGWATPVKRVWARSTPIAINAWGGAKKTYIARVTAMGGAVNAHGGKDPDVYWGWEARVLPLTRWSGDQSLRICFDFWQRNVNSVDNCVINYKIYEVS